MVNKSSILKDCKPCKRSFHGVKHKKRISLFSSIFLAFLPKCPFCFMAFSSTMILCGEGETHIAERNFSSASTIYFSLFFCLVALLSIILNYRDNRTKYAIALALLGSLSIVLSVTVSGGLPLYYFGVVLIFTGVWLNASLLYFAKKINDYLNKHHSRRIKSIG